MKTALALLLLAGAPSYATVSIESMLPSHRPPQPIGTSVTFTVKASDTNPGPLMFRFNVAVPHGNLALVKDFNVGTLKTGVWTSQYFVWVPTGVEGEYQVQVVAKDFASGETASKILKFQITPLVSGSTPVLAPTANPLVTFFSAPSCAAGSTMRVSFQPVSGSTPAATSNWATCHPPKSMTFEIAGVYPNTMYQAFAQTMTKGTTTNGPAVTFTTGTLPTNLPLPAFKVHTAAGPGTDTVDSVLLYSMGRDTSFPNVATDLSGNIMWYYYANDVSHRDLLTRPLVNGNILSIEDGTTWDPSAQKSQILRELDLAGNIVRETNSGVIQQQLVALGATNAGPCNAVAKPAPVGSACLGSFHHEFIQSLPDGRSAVIADIEKIFPAGTQGDTSGLPVDIVGDMIVVLDHNWQVIWYFDSFEHDGGAPQLDITRPAVLGETCVANQGGCPPIFLLGTGIAQKAHDWLHANSVYYWPTNGDLILSTRHQDWVEKIDYNNGKGTGNILWRMGPDGDFAINSSDPWPWFSHQHEVGIENNGAGPMSMFDNGNTRVSKPPLGQGSGNSRGMALTVDESNMQVTPVMSVDLGVFSTALGTAQLLTGGDYLFLPGLVFIPPAKPVSYTIEIEPTAGTTTGPQVLNIKGPEAYRSWQVPNLYSPPAT